MKGLLASVSSVALLLALASPSAAQRKEVFQDGVVAPNHLVKETTDGLIKDVGEPAIGDAQGVGVSPFGVNDKLNPLGIVTYGADPTVDGSYIALGHSASGVPTISVGAVGGAANPGCNFDINGVVTPCSPITGVWNAVNVVTDFGADPTGSIDATSAITAAVAAACNNVSPVFQVKEVSIPAGIYLVNAKIPVKNGCWIHGQGESGLGLNSGGTVIRSAGSFTVGDLFELRGNGAFRVSSLRLDVNAFFTGGASYCRVHNGGSGYFTGDTSTLAGGTFTTATVLKITAPSGAVTGCVVQTPGTYSVAPSSVAPVAQASTNGGGTGATFDVVYANSAAISISGPKTTLTATVNGGATSLTVDSIDGFSNGDQINIEQDNGVYFQTTISGAPSGNTITLASGLTFKASANHPVYGVYATQLIIEDVTCRGHWDCVRIDNAEFTTVRNFFALDYGHDGIMKFAGAYPDVGDDRFELVAWDLNRGTSNAGYEYLAGGGGMIGKSKFLGSKFNILLNSYFGPTGTLTVNGNSFEQSQSCSIRLHQSVSGVEYANVSVISNELSHLSGATLTQHFCVDAGTPTTAPKWIRNINFVGNHSNDTVTASVSSISIQDGDNIVVSGNALDNNGVAGATGISIGGAATHALEYGNEIVGFPTGKYGTMLDSSFDTFILRHAATVSYTVSTLPTGQPAGSRAHVSDQLTACAAIGAAITGGGAVTCPVFYNGSAWVSG